ncbi:MAG: hypothetical protein AAF317_20790, partial [Pseudomonadota bacterium]
MTVQVRTYLALAFIIAAVMPLAILWAWPYSRSLEAQKVDARERHLLVAENLASALEAYHRDIVTVFGTYADLIASGEGQEARPLFESLSFRHVCVADAATGDVVVDYSVDSAACPEFVPPERLRRFLALAKGGEISVSEIAQPARERDRIFLSKKAGTSLVIGAIYTDYFKRLRENVKFGREGHAVITDRSGYAISHPFEDGANKVLDLSGIAPFMRLQSGEAGVETFYSVLRQEQMIAGFAPVKNTGWGLMVPQPLLELEESAANLNRDALLVLCVGIAFSLIIALTLAQQLSRRLGDIASAVHEVAQDSDDIRVVPREHLVGIRELEELERDVNQVADGVASARRAQRDHNRDLELANARLTREMADRL